VGRGVKVSKYVVIGGFLGAGKTTSMIAFAEYLGSKGKKAAILVNDLGAKNLVDGSYTAASGRLCTEITGNCICYQTENLVDKLRRFRDTDRADIIFSDIPGCGIGALDHVYHNLNRNYPGEFELCPFVAVADPERLRMIMPEHADIHLPDEMNYLFDAQLREAEVILLNKIDLLSEEAREAYMDFLTRTYPAAQVFAISAREGQGVAEAADYLLSHSSGLPNVDIGYGGDAFIAAEKRLSWYNRRFYVKSRTGALLDGNQFTYEFVEAVRKKLRFIQRNVPHLKVFAAGENGAFAKLSLLGIDYELEYSQKFEGPQPGLRVVVNARAACESEALAEVMDAAMLETADAFQADTHVFFTECFGMMDEGRE